MITTEGWIQFFKDPIKARPVLEEDYGENYELLEEKRKQISSLLAHHHLKFGNQETIIIRAPGRLNLMGRHIDHQGGHGNLIAIDKEIWFVASLRRDSQITAYNIEDAKFPMVEFDLSNSSFNAEEDWTELVNDHNFLKWIRSPSGYWDNYFKAAMLKVMHSFPEKRIMGVNFSIVGNIPIGAGLSSSSALVTGILKALLNLNGIKVADYELINLAAEAEWFVGTRGGASDHAAIVLGKPNQIAHVQFLPLLLHEYVGFPEDYKVLIVDTNVISEKSGTKRDRFNQNVLAYEIGFTLLKQKFPQYNEQLEYLRDINTEKLDLSDAEVLELLLEIPEYVDFNDLSNLLGESWEGIYEKYQLNSPPQNIAIRKILLYGISECERAKIFSILLEDGDMETVGRLMTVSHNGDRIIEYDENLYEKFFDNEVTDADLKYIIEKEVQIGYLFGGYGYSIPRIDYIIDYSNMQYGVLGGQLSGAGLGGSAMVLVEKNIADDMGVVLRKVYKDRFHKVCLTHVVKPVNGCSLYEGVAFNKVVRDSYKNIITVSEEEQEKSYRYECIMCGNCCRAGFEIIIHADDVKRLIGSKKTGTVQYIEIDPKCISEESLGGFHIEEANIIQKLKDKYPEDKYKKKLEELKKFIDEKHVNIGESIYPLPIYTVFEEYGRNPILIPKSFVVMKDGWKKWGLVYRLSFGTSTECAFLENNLCSIHKIKPDECSAFPYDKEGTLREDEHALKICKGYKEITE